MITLMKLYQRAAVAVALLLLTPVATSTVWADEVQCARTSPATVSMRDLLPDPGQYGVVREKIVGMALAEAVREAVGAVVKSRTTVTTLLSGDTMTDSMKELLAQKSGGRIQSYKVKGEAVESGSDPGERFLRLDIDAVVCVPDLHTIPTIVAVGSFTGLDGRELAALRPLVMAALPDSTSLVLADGSAKESYHDVLVTGRLVKADSAVVDNTEKIRLVTQMAGAAVAARIPPVARHVTVIVAVEASDPGSGETLVETSEQSRNIPPNANDASVIDELSRDAAKTAAAQLFAKLAARHP